MSRLYCHVWLALYGPSVDGLLRYRDGRLHAWQAHLMVGPRQGGVDGRG